MFNTVKWSEEEEYQILRKFFIKSRSFVYQTSIERENISIYSCSLNPFTIRSNENLSNICSRIFVTFQRQKGKTVVSNVAEYFIVLNFFCNRILFYLSSSIEGILKEVCTGETVQDLKEKRACDFC